MSKPNTRVGGIVLTGGKSRRMGAPKEWLTLGRETMLLRVVSVVKEIVSPVVVAARPGQALPTLPQDVLVVPDAIADAGPLAGMAAGFDALAESSDAAFVISCDHPLLQPALIRILIESLGENRAVMPVLDGRSYPLVAVYRLDTRDALHRQLDAGELRVRTFADQCKPESVSGEMLRSADPELESLLNVNDPAQYKQVLRRLGQRRAGQ